MSRRDSGYNSENSIEADSLSTQSKEDTLNLSFLPTELGELILESEIIVEEATRTEPELQETRNLRDSSEIESSDPYRRGFFDTNSQSNSSEYEIEKDLEEVPRTSENIFSDIESLKSNLDIMSTTKDITVGGRTFAVSTDKLVAADVVVKSAINRE